MRYQKNIKLLDNTSNHHSKFRKNKWIEVNDDDRWTDNARIQIKFKTSMVKLSPCDYSDANIIVIKQIGK